MKMSKEKLPERYVYPAVFTYYGEGEEIAVDFPDLEVATSGKDDQDALFSARECLGLVMYGLEKDGEKIPVPSLLSEVNLEDNETVGLVDVYMPSIRSAHRTKAVNHTDLFL